MTYNTSSGTLNSTMLMQTDHHFCVRILEQLTNSLNHQTALCSKMFLKILAMYYPFLCPPKDTRYTQSRLNLTNSTLTKEFFYVGCYLVTSVFCFFYNSPRMF